MLAMIQEQRKSVFWQSIAEKSPEEREYLSGEDTAN
jgi:hypothetical protein